MAASNEHSTPTDEASAFAPVIATEKKRRRPPLACEQCRRRKIKCDKESPCGHCTRARLPNCTYSPIHVPASKGKVKTSSALPALPALKNASAKDDDQRPGRPERPVPAPNSMLAPREHSAPSPGSLGRSKASSSMPNSNYGSASDSPDVDYLIARVRELEDKLANGVHISDDNQKPDATVSMRVNAAMPRKGTVSKTRYFGNSHWANVTNLLPTEFDMLGRANAEQTDVVRILSQCKTLGRKIKQNRQRPLSSETLGQSIPRRELADQLVEKYLGTFEGVLRILHIPTFRSEYERYWQNPGAAGMSFVIQLQLCLALGATVYDDIFSLRAVAMHWVSEAQLWLMLPPEKAKMTITGIQIWCLLVLAKTCCGVGQDLIWVTMGSLIRLAMYMGLHRDPRHLGKMTVYRAEIRRRLWATILELNLQAAFEAGGSPLLSVTDYDTEAPANLNDDQLGDDNDGETIVGQAADVPTQTSVQLAILKSMPLRLNLLRIINDFKASRPYEEILRLNSELTKVCRELSHKLCSLQSKGAAADKAPMIEYFHVSVAEMFLYRFFHALHQMAIAKAFDDDRFYFSRRMCLDSALKLLHVWGITKPQPSNDTEEMLDFRRIVNNGTGIFRYIAVQSLFFVAVELIHEKQGQSGSSLGYLPSVGNPDLRACLEAARVWTLDRVEAGETNGKAHCFVAACLSHIDALSAGLSKDEIDNAILQAATASAHACWQALIEVAAREGVSAEEDSASAETVEMDGITTMSSLEWMGDWRWDDGMDGLMGTQFPDASFDGYDESLAGNFLDPSPP